jgi:protein-tyrosine-phosphatase
LAETYLNSKQIPNIKAISSGIVAERNDCGPITWYSQKIIQQNHWVPFEKPTWDQTTKILLEEGDLTIFMNQDIYDFVVEHFAFNGKNFQIWDIHDTDKPFATVHDEVRKIEITENIFKEIQQKIDELIRSL